MRYRDAVAFRQAPEQRLKARAGGDGARVSRDRKRVAFDRLLARLAAAAPDQWLLKGGFALDLRLAERARATKDIDLDWHAAEDELLDSLIDAATYEAGGLLRLRDPARRHPKDRLGGSHRFRVAASLAGRPFETFALDVGFRDAEVTMAEQLITPDILAFAGIEPVTVAAIPLELHVAEKLHAYTRTYEGARPSTRARTSWTSRSSPISHRSRRRRCETRSTPPSLAATPTRYPPSFRRRPRTGEPHSANWPKRSASQPSSPTLTPTPPPCSIRSSPARSGSAPGSRGAPLARSGLSGRGRAFARSSIESPWTFGDLAVARSAPRAGSGVGQLSVNRRRRSGAAPGRGGIVAAIDPRRRVRTPVRRTSVVHPVRRSSPWDPRAATTAFASSAATTRNPTAAARSAAGMPAGIGFAPSVLRSARRDASARADRGRSARHRTGLAAAAFRHRGRLVV